MISNINDILHIMNYEVVEGSPFLWSCYGKTARIMYFGRGEPAEDDNWTVSVIFDSVPKKGTIYEVIIDQNAKVYRWINPKFLKKYLAECAERNIQPNCAYDDVNFIEIDNIANLEKFLKMLYKNNKVPM